MTVEDFVCDCCALKIAYGDTSGCDGEHRENLVTFPEVTRWLDFVGVTASWLVTVREESMDSEWCFGCGELIGHANFIATVEVTF